MSKAFLAALAMTLAPLGAAAGPLDRFSDIFVFGDSLSDPGNLFNALTGAPKSPVFPIYPAAQFTDGDTWASQIGADFASGTNFAYGSARGAESKSQIFTFPDTSTPDDPTDTVDIPFDVPDFADQIALYQAADPTLGSNPLAAVWFGGNDLRDAIGADNPETVIGAALGAIGTGIGALIGEGFTNLAVFGLPDLGKIPEIRTLGDTAMAAATGASLAFNAGLQGLLGAVPHTVEVSYIDTFGLFTEILGDPGSFGFTNATAPCVDALVAGVVTRCDGYVFYDDIHPTAQAHALLAERFIATVAPVPLPAGWILILFVAAILGLLRRSNTAQA